MLHFLWFTGKMKPTLKEMQRSVTLKYASQWKKIGIELEIKLEMLNIIEANNPRSVVDCCNTMLSTWLKVNPKATWNQLNEALDSPALDITSMIISAFVRHVYMIDCIH